MKIKCEQCGKEIDKRGKKMHSKYCKPVLKESSSASTNEVLEKPEEKPVSDLQEALSAVEVLQPTTEEVLEQEEQESSDSSTNEVHEKPLNLNLIAFLAALVILAGGLALILKNLFSKEGENNE